jgi:tRNA(Leu) C34 or U34 (ribose-2'-O)-methylase TrmL
MFEIILFAPQIPPNTGNIIRLSANSGNRLHLVKPLGFALDEKSCRRACIAPDHKLRLPMVANNRSLNLANAVSIVIYEAWRQHDFAGS